MMFLASESVVITIFTFILEYSLCMATVQTTATHFIKGKTVATSYKTLQSYSKIKCVEKCFAEKRQNRCSIAGYNKVTKTCFLSNDGQQDLLDANEEFGVMLFSGMFSYECNIAQNTYIRSFDQNALDFL